MICIIALVVFSIMGIFSATHREMAKEAFDCVFKRMTFQPCTTGFDEKMKGKIVGKLLLKSPTAARFTNKHFELLSWLFLAITVLSLAYSVLGIYNYLAYGNCNGQDSNAVCILSATGLYHSSTFNSSGNESGPILYTPCGQTNYTTWRATNGSGG